MIKNKEILTDSLKLFVLYIITAYIGYFASYFLKIILFLLIFYFVINTKKYYFWLAYFVLIESEMAGFFMEATRDSSPLPLISFMSFSFTVTDIFMIISIMKYLKGKRFYIKDQNLNPIILLFTVLVIYTLLISFIWGMGEKEYQILSKLPVYYPLLFFFPYLLEKENGLFKFFYLLLPFNFIELFSILYSQIQGTDLISLFNPSREIFKGTGGEGMIRPANLGYSLNMISIICGLFLITLKSEIVRKNYIWICIAMAFASIFLGQTRQLIITAVMIIMFFFVFIEKTNLFSVISVFILFAGFYWVLSHNIFGDTQMMIPSTIDRIAGGVELKGDKMEAADSFEFRINFRLPWVLKGVEESFPVGFGFSTKFFKYNDSHVGGLINLVLQTGIFGLGLMLLIFYNLIIYNIKFLSELGKEHYLYKGVKLLTFVYFPLFILNAMTDYIYMVPVALFIKYSTINILTVFALRKFHLLKNFNTHGQF